MSQVLSVLGSTGSIGTQTLECADLLGLSVAALAARRDVTALEAQVRRWRPELAAVYEEEAARDLRVRLRDLDTRVVSGMEGLEEAAALPAADTVVTAVVGMVGLRPTLAAAAERKRIALANKETLVCAGELVMDRVRQAGAELVPVDSEHSALFQCLQGCRDRGEVKRLVLTASGGPFLGWDRDRLASVTPQQALRHPNWHMGAKVTIDSATLMNKGLELIEAMRLYALPPEKIQIVLHPQSMIHSLVEYCDNALLAQLGAADMRLPIQFALTYPHRCPSLAGELDLASCPPLTFLPPDRTAFPCLALAERAARTGGTACAVLNGANEAAVALFLEEKIGFLDIPDLVGRALDTIPARPADSLEAVLEADAAARRLVLEGRG